MPARAPPCTHHACPHRMVLALRIVLTALPLGLHMHWQYMHVPDTHHAEFPRANVAEHWVNFYDPLVLEPFTCLYACVRACGMAGGWWLVVMQTQPMQATRHVRCAASSSLPACQHQCTQRHGMLLLCAACHDCAHTDARTNATPLSFDTVRRNTVRALHTPPRHH